MAYRSTKARITGKIASGGFNQPDNTLAKAIDTGAGIMSKSILKKAEEDRIEAKEEKRRAAAAARSHAAAQAKKEEAARKRERATLAIAASVGVDPKNTAAVNAIALDVEVFGAGGAMTKVSKDYEDGKFQLPTVDVLGPETQGPDLPSSSAVPVAGLDNPVAIDDLEATSTEMLLSQETRDSAKQQMAITSPVSEIKPEVVGQEQGFVFDPAAKKSEIDWLEVKDPKDVANLRRLHNAGRQVLSGEDLTVLEVYEKDFQAASDANLAAENAEVSRDIMSMNEEGLLGVINSDSSVYSDEMRTMAQGLYNKKVGIREGVETEEALATSKKSKQDITQMDIPGLRTVLAAPDSVYSQEEKAIAQAELDSKTGFASAEAAEQAAEDALTFRRSLVGKDADYLRDVVASGSFTPEEKLEAAAQLASRPGEPFEITDYDDVKDATIQTIIAADGTDPKKVTALQALLSNRANTAPKVDAKSQDYLVTYLDEAGEQQVTVAKLAADGSGFVDLTSLKPVSPVEGTSPLNMEMQSDLYDKFVKINTSLIKPLKEQRVAMVTTLGSAKKLDDLAKATPEILTTIGSAGPQILKRIGLEGKAAFDLISGAGGTEAGLSLIDQRFEQYISDVKLSGTAKAAALFQAEKVKMAFMFAASSLGQSGQGLSDKDFLRALSILDQGSDYTTFSENMRSQMQAVILKTETMITDFNEDGAVNILGGLDTSKQLLAGYQQDAKTYSANRGLGDAFTWANSAISESSGPPVINSKEERDALPSGTKYIDPDGNLRTKK